MKLDVTVRSPPDLLTALETRARLDASTFYRIK